MGKLVGVVANHLPLAGFFAKHAGRAYRYSLRHAIDYIFIDFDPAAHSERNVLGFAVETINTDAGQSYRWPLPYPCHTLMHGAGRFGLQCLRNLDQLPPTGAVIIAAPLKIQTGSGSPLRVLALLQS